MAELDVDQLMLSVRKLVVGLEDEQRRLRRHLRDLPLTSSDNNNNNRHRDTPPMASSTATNTSSSTNTTINTNNRYASPTTDDPSTNTLSSLTSTSATTGSTRPPPYKSVVKVLTQVVAANVAEPPQAPLRTKRRFNNRVRITSNLDHIIPSSEHRNSGTIRMTSSGIAAGRGALIVLEGLDRVGKSTLAKRLVEHLETIRRPVAYCRFPDRTTRVGQVINEYLQDGHKKVNNHIMHLLFSSNRWELNERIRHTINKGTTIILDRYSYSGIAYSSAKKDISLDLCLQTEKGLPRPDLVIYLELPKEVQQKRDGFGDERYETEEMQELVRKQYELVMKMSFEEWIRVDVENKSVEQVLAEVILPVKRCIENSANKELGSLDFVSSN